MTCLDCTPKKHWADRRYEPDEAAFAAAQYLDMSPDFFIRQFKAAGFDLSHAGGVINFHAWGEPDMGRHAFLLRLLRISGLGKALRTSLRRRGRFDVVARDPEPAADPVPFHQAAE